MRHLFSVTVAASTAFASSSCWSAVPKCVYALGDSLTAAYVSELTAALPGVNVIDGGLGGQGSTSIAVRAGAIPVTAKVISRLIAEATHTLVASVHPGLLAFSGNHTELRGRLGNVEGCLIWDRETGYRCERAKRGPAVHTSPDVSFEVDTSEVRQCTLVNWAGRNGFENPQSTIKDIEGITKLWNESGSSFFVLSLINGTDEGTFTDAHQRITIVNDLLKEKYKNYIDLRK